MNISEPPLADTLKVMLPSLHDGLFLRVLVGPQADAGDAWARWQGPISHLRPFLSGRRPDLKRLLPLVAYRLRQADVAVDPDMQHLLNAAQLWEEKRTKRIVEIFSMVFDRLSTADISPKLVSGLATSASAYPGLALRHCHDIDFLLPPDEISRAGHLLVEAGFEQLPVVPGIGCGVCLRHGDGLPINLHATLTDSTFFRLPEDRISDRAVALDVGGRMIDILDPEGALLHRLGVASIDKAAEPINALADAALILGPGGFENAQWQRFTDDALSARLGPQMFVLLDYLRRVVSCPVPATVLRLLADASLQPSAECVDMALHHARYGHKGDLSTMIVVSNWRSRLRIVRWLVLPSSGYLRNWCIRRGVAWTPLWYVGRPFRRALRRLSLLCGSTGG